MLKSKVKQEIHWEKEKAMIESKITAKGQTTLPKAVREALAVEAGDRVRYTIHDGEVRITPLRPISRLYGVLQYDGPAKTLDEMEEGIASGACDS